MSVEQTLLALKKRKHVSKQTAKQNHPASRHGKCCCFVNRNAPALSRRVLMMCVKVITLGNKFHFPTTLISAGRDGEDKAVALLSLS